MGFVRVDSLSAVLAACLVTLAAAGARAADFVGAETCRSCHAAAYEQWRQSPHAQALQSLTAEQKTDARCLQCHAPNQAAGGDPGVSCESCHGAGEYYWPNYVMRDAELARATGLVLPEAKSCAACHDASAPSLEPFDAKAKMALIDHWSADRAARKAKAGSKAEAPSPEKPNKSACLQPSRRPASATPKAARPQESVLGRLLTSHPAVAARTSSPAADRRAAQAPRAD